MLEFLECEKWMSLMKNRSSGNETGTIDTPMKNMIKIMPGMKNWDLN